MKVYIKVWSIFFISFFVLSLCCKNLAYAAVLNDTANQEEQSAAAEQEGRIAQFVKGEIIVKLKEKESSQALFQQRYSTRKAKHKAILSRIKNKHKLREERAVFKRLHKRLKAQDLTQRELRKRIKAKFARRRKRPPKETKPTDLLPVYLLKTDEDVLAACDRLNQDPDVIYAEPNYIREICMVPDDPYYDSYGSWGQDYYDLWGLKRIQCGQAWDESQGDGIVVAVIDTGVDYNHEDFFRDENANCILDPGEQYNIWINPNEIPDNGIDDDENGYTDDVVGWDFIGADHNNPTEDKDPMDGNGHGTHCAGTVAAVGNNGLGVIGVAPGAKIMPLKGLSDAGEGYDSNLAQCIYYAADNGANVLSNSWGGYGHSQTLEDAVNDAYSKGCVIVAAAGNENGDSSNHCPSNLRHAISVSAIDHNNNRSRWNLFKASNYGEEVDVCAPGGGDPTWAYDSEYQHMVADILSVMSAESNITPGLVVGGAYYRSGGTSMACPHVSGVAALVLSRHPEFNGFEVRQALRITADDLGPVGFDVEFGYGRVNAYNAVSLDTFPIMGYISSLKENNFVRGSIDIIASVYGTELGGYELYWWPKGAPDQKTLISSSISEEPIDNEVIGGWDTSLFGDGNYELGLKTIGTDSSYLWYMTEVKVDNVNSPPVFDKFIKDPAYVGEEYNLVINAANEDDPDTPHGQLAYEAILIPPGSIFDPDTATLEWMPTSNDLGYNTCVFRVSDSTYNDYMITQILVLSDEIEEVTLIDDCGPALPAALWEDYLLFVGRYWGPVDLFNGDTLTQIDYPGGLDAYAMRDNRVALGLRGGIINIYNIEDISTPFVHTTACDGDLVLDISGDKIVYSSRRSESEERDIYLYDISTQEEIYIAQATLQPNIDLQLQFWGDNIVWKDTNTHLYTISTGEPPQQLDGVDLGAIYGDKILFTIGEDIYCYNISAGITEHLVLKNKNTMSGVAGYDRYYKGDCFWNQRVVYEDIRYRSRFAQPGLTSDIFVYDLIAETEIRITHTTHFSHTADDPLVDTDYKEKCSSPTIWADKIVWFRDYQPSPELPSYWQVKLATLPVFNNPPELGQIEDKLIHEWEDVEFIINATDFESEALTYEALNLPIGAEFDPQTRRFIWNTHSDQQGDYKVFFIASDGNNLDLMGVNIKVLNHGNQPPDLNHIGDKEIDEDEDLAFRIYASDPDGDNLVYSVSNLPEGASFNNQTNIFSWTPTFDQQGDYNVTFAVSDGEYNSTETIIISVLNVDRPPVLDSVELHHQWEAYSCSRLRVRARDPEGEHRSLTFTTSELPEGASFRFSSNSTSCLASLGWIPELSQIGPYDITFTVSDGEHEVSVEVHIDVVEPSIQPTVVRVLRGGYPLEGVIVDAAWESEFPYPSVYWWWEYGYGTTDSNGEEHFIISEGDRVKFVAYYRETYHWSDVVEAPDEITIYIANQPPDISAIPDSLTKNEGDTITAEEIELATDSDGNTLTYTYSGWLTSLPYTIKYDDAGEYGLHVDVSDGTDTVGKDIIITVNNIVIDPPTVSLTLTPSTVQVEEEFTITVGGESPLGLASVWWWVTDINDSGSHPGSAYISGTIDGVQCNLATAHDWGEGAGQQSHSYTRTMTITEPGEYEFGANSRDILYPTPGEPHQASEGEGMAFELVRVEGIDFEAVKANELLWTFSYEELSLLPGPVEEQVWRFGYAERGGCTGWRHAASRLRSPIHEFPSEKEYNITLIVKVGGVIYTKTKAIYID